MTISPGENVGPYRITEQLGSGGMATVYKAYQPALDRYVAIKVMHAMFKGNPQFFERFQREARIVAKLEHPNIIPIHDFNEHNGEPYLVMRYVEGDTLKTQMDGQIMPVGQVLHIIRPVCSALHYAHDQGILHRDIKPSNIMMTTDGSIFVTDFGLARIMEAGESTLSQDMMVGTPQYISPEQAQGVKELDGRTDIYSLGVILYEMLTGRVPFSADTPFATVHDHIYTPLPPPSSVNPEITPQVERMLLKALAKNPEDRHSSAKDLLEAVETVLNGQGEPAAGPEQISPPPPAPEPVPEEPTTLSSRKSASTPWWVWAGGAGLALLLVVAILIGALLFFRPRQNPPPPAPPAGQAEQPPGQLPAPSGVDPNSPEFQEAAGVMREGQDHLRNNDPQAALDAFSHAEDLIPESPLPYAGQALSYLMLDEDEAAKEAIDQALAIDPHHPEARLAHAIYQLRQDNRQEARQELRELAQDPNASPFVRERADQLLRR